MLGIKPFIQETVQALSPSELRLLAETLRIDLRGCENREDIERVLTSLVCLDQETSLGTFLSWLRSATSQQQNIKMILSRKSHFTNTFIPTTTETNSQQSDSNEQVEDLHVDDEIKQQLNELEVIEASFKKTERLVHTGSPSFEKLKQFLMELAMLRGKEQSMRVFLIRRVHTLQKQYDHLQDQLSHCRAQLEFFVEGFTNLRKRHDALLNNAIRMKAENETAQELFIGMSGHDCYFELLMHNTLTNQMQRIDKMNRKITEAENSLESAAERCKKFEAQISKLKHERGDARKNAICLKRQLRVCKMHLRRLQGGIDGLYFRDQAVILRQSVATLVGLLREAVEKDTKSPKQILSKEVLKVLYQVLTPTDHKLAFQNELSLRDGENIDLKQPRVIQRQRSVDIDEVIKGVLLVEVGTSTYGGECAKKLGEKLNYLPIDLEKALVQFQQIEEEKIGKEQDVDLTSDSFQLLENESLPITIRAPAPSLEAYNDTLQKHIVNLMTTQSKRGFVLFNWPFSTRDVNLLIATGLSVDCVIILESLSADTLNLQGLGCIMHSIKPTTFTADRMNAVLEILEQQKRHKVAPVVHWDELTCCNNERLALWTEEIHMLCHLEQEKRKQKSLLEPAVGFKLNTTTSKKSTIKSKNPTRSLSKAKETVITKGRLAKK
ncbi:uncharacterized protein PHALS_10256 [Plasmopara halstedii]|uniref:Uncharacterized protein n=1 Tax=Plasmopara halstedii TaxID=4781 RepID=A0A0P1AG56_PLAHL|nr:uncharacterized protein PHALS_10256 [Plasmopara halstedii]CEG40034.1 hypothetical protein PHALS_10256 [Plasmopara halstedii]|eukprot:XP_024576403.1 hypothetical protein PHALS_10256 [Plasmopara halstedii]